MPEYKSTLESWYDSEYEWDYIIESVVGKNPRKRNRYHDLIIGKRCVVPENQKPPYYIGSMIVEAFGDNPSPRWFYTTLVQRIDKQEDGTLVMETENSVYTFKPIRK